MRTYEEKIGVRLPGHGFEVVTMRVSGDATDEEIMRRISTAVGTLFNIGGVKYEVTSSLPFRIKQLPREQEPEPAVEKPKAVKPKQEPKPKADSVPPPPSERRVSLQVTPRVGERWKPKDPRRIADFTVVAIEGDQAVTDDGRRIQLARFKRYEQVSDGPASKVS